MESNLFAMLNGYIYGVIGWQAAMLLIEWRNIAAGQVEDGKLTKLMAMAFAWPIYVVEIAINTLRGNSI